MDPYEGYAEFVAARQMAFSRVAYLLTGDHHAAQDLVQSALVKLARHWRRISTGGDPEAYLRRIMVNERNTWWRSRPPEPVDPVPEQAGRDEATHLATRTSLMAALRALPPRQRAVIVLRYYADLTEAQTAEALGCAVGTVKSQTHVALARLRQLLPATTFSEVTS
jgi:RNA polymerase sigma-70 factor (sigma-E family)